MKKNHQKLVARLMTVLAVVLMTAASMNAQSVSLADMENLSNDEKAQALTTKQAEELQFYDDQEQQMYDLNLKYILEMERIMAGGRNFSTMMKLRDMGGEKDKAVKKVLDKDQWKTYQKMQEAMRAELKARMRGNG